MKSAPAVPKLNRLLIATILIFVALSAAFSFATRLKFGPDEPAHFIYVRSMAVDHVPPPISHQETRTEDSAASHEGHQPPLYYALMAVPFALLKALGLSSDAIWRVLRLLNIPIGALWVYLVYRLARDYFRPEGYGLGAAAFAALIPTASYISGVINNEMLISALFTWSLIPMLAYFRSGKMPPKAAAGLGSLIGLAILAKAQGMALVPLFLLAAVVVVRRQGYANWKDVLKTTALVLGVGAVVSGWWFVWCVLTYGTPMPHSLYNPMTENGLIDLLFSPVWGLKLVLITGAALYGYFWTPFWLVWKYLGFVPYISVLAALTLAALIGFIIRLRRNGDLDRKGLAYLIAAPVLVYVLWLRYVVEVDPGANLQGRLLLSTTGPIAIAWVLGFDGLLKPRRAKKVGAWVGLGLMLIANLAVIGCTIAFYAG